MLVLDSCARASCSSCLRPQRRTPRFLPSAIRCCSAWTADGRVALTLLVGYQLYILRRRLKARVFGSKLTLRLVVLFALVGILPGALIYGVSVQFLARASSPGSRCASTRRSKGASTSAAQPRQHAEGPARKAETMAVALSGAAASAPAHGAQYVARAGAVVRGDPAGPDRHGHRVLRNGHRPAGPGTAAPGRGAQAAHAAALQRDRGDRRSRAVPARARAGERRLRGADARAAAAAAGAAGARARRRDRAGRATATTRSCRCRARA